MRDAEALYRFGGPGFVWPLTVEQLASSESSPGHSAWVMCEGEAPAGQFELRVTGAEAWLSRVIIDPEQRGRGLSHQLVAFAMGQARALGAATIGLRVIADNEPAIRAYASAGFKELAERVRPDAITMRAMLISRPARGA